MQDRGAAIAALTPSVRIAGLSSGYGGEPVLDGISLEVQPGQRVALLGPNGGGKSTLIRTLSGELQPLTGSFAIEGRPGVVPQHDPGRHDWPASTLDVAICGTLDSIPWWRTPGRAERARARAALESVGLSDREGTAYGELSGGQRRRAQVAAALAGGSDVLLLDEPFAGLDAIASEEMEELLATLAARGRTLMVATHDLDQAASWERVLCLNGSQVAFGPPSTTLTRETLRRTFGSDIVELDDGTLLTPPHHHDHDHGH